MSLVKVSQQISIEAKVSRAELVFDRDDPEPNKTARKPNK